MAFVKHIQYSCRGYYQQVLPLWDSDRQQDLCTCLALEQGGVSSVTDALRVQALTLSNEACMNRYSFWACLRTLVQSTVKSIPIAAGLHSFCGWTGTTAGSVKCESASHTLHQRTAVASLWRLQFRALHLGKERKHSLP